MSTRLIEPEIGRIYQEIGFEPERYIWIERTNGRRNQARCRKKCCPATALAIYRAHDRAAVIDDLEQLVRKHNQVNDYLLPPIAALLGVSHTYLQAFVDGIDDFMTLEGETYDPKELEDHIASLEGESKQGYLDGREMAQWMVMHETK